MGDTAVDFFLETLKNLITSSNLDFIVDKKHQLQSLADEIRYLRGFLKTTEKKRNEHSEVMNLVMQIRDVVSEAENIVELFVVLVYKANHASDSRREHHDNLSLDLQSVKKEIKTLTAEVKKIYNENMYDINRVTVKKLEHSSARNEGLSGGSNTSIVIEKKVVVGFKEEVETLMGKLHDIRDGGRLEIISIVGVGGGGKTTLAREVYDHPLTLQKFEIRAWVNVSQDYNKTMKRDLLTRILELTSPGKHEDSEDKLGEKILKCLKGRKYLIVMDDIWDIEAWNDIQRSLPKECKGSKVLFTSRLLVQPNSVPHYLAPLPKSCSWELLQKKVFGKQLCPPELVGIGEQIAEKCGGLPLGIVAIAGILATEDKTLDVWKKVAKHLSSIIAKNQEDCMEILELSYNHLPLHLKACFLYIGAHPEDYEISVRELIWLWIAEGFIRQSEGGESLEEPIKKKKKTLEDIAEAYLTDLINRSLVMVAWKKPLGGIKACRIHDLLRELCLKKAEEDNFFVKIYEDEPISPSATNKHRRLFIGSKFFHKFSSRPCARNLRSFLCLKLPNSSHFEPNSSRFKQNLSFFVENFELLRVLHLISATSLGEIGIGDLVHLRYLAFTFPRVEILPAPSYFHYLSNLETLILHVSFSDRISLPRDIVKMVKLRHLHTKGPGAFEYHHVSYDEEEGNMLDSLQTLRQICTCELCQRLLRRTPNLRRLGLSCPGVFTLPNLEFLECIEMLEVYVEPDDYTWEDKTSSDSYATNFERARVASTGLKLPPTLRQLTLGYTELEWEELSIILQPLPSLEVLKLYDYASRGRVWDTTQLEEGFSQLKYLALYDQGIKEWNASADEFPRLEVLVLSGCRKLKGIPIDFANLNDLREIRVDRCSRSVEESARKIQEEQRNIRGDDDCVNLDIRCYWVGLSG